MEQEIQSHANWAVIGAGPAGLTAAFTLAHKGCNPTVLEATGYIGGISRTHLWQGNRIDIGGHRFFTQSVLVKQLWAQMMEEPMIEVPRLSRIYYKGKFFDYPLQLGNTIANLGVFESLMIIGSYCKAQLFPERSEESFEQWVRNRFGDRLYRTFFKTYTEKVWGIPCDKIRADWAAQRIQGLSFISAVANAIRNTGEVKSLIKTFDYPRLGPGMLWESCARKVTELGGQVVKDTGVTCVRHQNGRVTALDVTTDGITKTLSVENVISTMPLSNLAGMLDPPPPLAVREAANGLRHRDFLIVALTCHRSDPFPDNWIYIHAQDVRVGRIQNFRNWSADMIATGNGTTLGMEYFCSRGDDLWSQEDSDLIALAKREVAELGLVNPQDVIDGHVIRERNAYPVYDEHYRAHVDTLRSYFTETFSNLQTAGRSGLHRYNNQDHSMLAGHYAAMKLLGHSECDPWDVNVERSYHEDQVLSAEKTQFPADQDLQRHVV